MNKYLYILASLAFAAVSCTNLQEEDLLLEEEDEKVEITAGINIESGFATKTYISPIHDVTQGAQYPILWSEGDEIALISDKISTFTIDSEVKTVGSDNFGPGNTLAKFSGSASALSGKFPGTKGYPAAYPTEGAEAFLPVDGKFMVGSYLPAKQSFVDGSFADNVFPMAAVSMDGINYNFENLCGIVQINIQSDESVDESKPQKIRAIYFYGNDGEEVAGGIGMWFDAKTGEAVSSTVYKDNGKKVEVFGDESNEKLVIDFGANLLTLSKTDVTSINLAVLPQTFSKGFTVEVVDKNMGSTYYKTDSITIKRSMIKEITPVIKYIAPEPIEIANCYIYDEPGTYLMPAFAMGNRLDVRIDVAKHPNLNADLLWTDIIDPATGAKKDFISDLKYIKMDDGNNMMQFKIKEDPDTGDVYRGNAMIALYDEDTKEILWTWHLWLTDYHDVITGGSCADGSYDFKYTIAGSEYEGHFKGDAASGKMIILDRNIGAIAATPTDCDKDGEGNPMLWQTYGLYYQDGRKDPFIGGHYNGKVDAGSKSYSMEAVMKTGRPDETTPFTAVADGEEGTARTWWNNVLAPKGWNWKNGFLNVTQSIQNPMCYSSGFLSNRNPQWTLYTDPDNKSWLNQSAPATRGKNNTTSGTHGSTGLADAGHEAYWNRTKTIMDPCPVGYTVLGERSGKFINSDFITFDTANPYGVTTQLSGQSAVWWPAAGVRTIDGKIADVGHYGAYFYYDHISATHGGHGMLFEITTNTVTWKVKANAGNGGVITGHSTPIRCVRAKQFVNGQPSPALK